MKSVFLSVVIICALAISGIGGTLATWSDSETSWDNYVETGSLDLKVNDADDEPWGTGVETKVELSHLIPEKWIYGGHVTLWNAGQYSEDDAYAEAYIHLKNLECSNIDPKEDEDGNTTGYPDPVSGDLKPEPELVAEWGGRVDSTMVPGIGPTGDDCSMATHIKMAITYDMNPPLSQDYDPVVPLDLLEKYYCNEIYLFDLVPCNEKTIYLWFYLIQETEEDYGHNYFLSPAELGLSPGDEGYEEALLHWTKFNDWPSWALMKDRVDFDLEFDLLLLDP
jgi:predicted ribosomally synthesized peptide with SipW-like signal peptide